MIPAIVGAIRAATAQPGQAKRRFWRAYLIGMAVETVIALIGFGICLAILSQNVG